MDVRQQAGYKELEKRKWAMTEGTWRRMDGVAGGSLDTPVSWDRLAL